MTRIWGICVLEAAGRGIWDGFKEAIQINREVISNDKVQNSVAETLKICEPWSDHIDRPTRDTLTKKLLTGTLEDSSSIIDDSWVPTAAPWCVAAIRAAFSLIESKQAKKIVLNATFNLLGL